MARVVLAMCVVMMLAAPARGDDPPTKAPELTEREAVLVGDTAATVFIGLAALIEWKTWDCECDTAGGGPFWVMGLGAYLVFPPMAHGEAGHRGRAAVSALSRIALPVGALVLARSRDWDAGPTLALTAGGMLSAMALDWFVLTRIGSNDPAPVSVYVAPTGGGGVIAGVGGTL